jgi:hypothetical protein
MSNFNWKSISRLILMKTLGVFLAVLFLLIALVFVSDPLIALATSRGGEDAKVVVVSNHLNKKLKTGCRIGGLFLLSVEKSEAKHGSHQKPVLFNNIYTLYPSWPDQLEPTKGDILRVWPSKKPLIGAPAVEGWGWFIVGTVFVLGLVFLEFAFLAVTIA